MSILTIILTIAVVGFVVWLIVTLIPMPEPFPKVIIALACFALLIYLLQSAGVIHGWLKL